MDWHVEAIRVMWEAFRPTLYYCSNLHTKLYLAECDGFRCAIFGSPNLTGRADGENRELAIEFRTTVESREDDVAAIISRLADYARDLAAEDDVKLIEKI
jgi:phosphatidylserine/phosphatidylglycerophosphate/cardiolipin synthase-like enzyme